MRIQEIIYRPIVSDTDRITSLLDGSVDFVQDVPLAELEVLKQAPGLNLKVGAENRVIFLGLSVVPMLADKPNPLANIALREAVSLAIDRLAIQREIMLGQSIPTGVVAPPGINGFPRELDQIPPRDLVKAKALVNSVAGDGPIALTLDCPTNRYVNDAAICGAIKKQLADIGIQVTLHLQEKGKHIETVRSGQSQFFLLGWGVPTFDSAYIFTNLLHTRGPHLGTWNGTGYSNAELDQLIAQLPQVTGVGARGRAMGTIWQIANDARIYIPLHVQTLIYAMRSSINIDVDISNTPKLKNATLTAPPPPKSK
jgi:peptide/nickel transport system substrate-binding protein